MKKLFLAVIIIAAMASCVRIGKKSNPDPVTGKSRMEVVDCIGVGGVPVYILKVDSVEYIINTEGGVCKHE